MLLTIRRTLQSGKELGTLFKKKFYFIHFNALCEVSQIVFYVLLLSDTFTLRYAGKSLNLIITQMWKVGY